MSIVLKCKMCGGDIEVNDNMTIGVCQYCGSSMTLPKIDSEKKARLFNIANQYRLNNEFDRAYETYKDIVKEDEQESEAYWGMLLSLYGVEYVEDPVTHKQIPTCHRTLIKSIKNTADFENVCKYADVERKILYKEEADLIDRIQKKIISVSSKEEPYDVFICYKELEDISGERTEDSVLAQTIYDYLEQKKIRTFFARISLEDKLGQDYEPYIYAALKSAKVMLLVTTSSQHVEAVWVKNEWKRYLSFMNDKLEKTIIPVYKNMTAYELPSELVKFQSQNIEKVGAVQDLIHAVEKIVKNTSKTKESSAADVIISTMLKRADESLKQGNWKKASNYYESVLDYDSNNIKAYIGLLLAERKCYEIDDLSSEIIELKKSKYYNYIIKNCDEQLHKKLNNINKKITSNIKYQKIKSKRLAIIWVLCGIIFVLFSVMIIMLSNYYVKPYKDYKDADNQLKQGNYEQAYNMYLELDSYRDSFDKLVECVYSLELVSIDEKIDDCEYYEQYKEFMTYEQKNNIAIKYYEFNKYDKAMDLFKEIGNEDYYNKAVCEYAKVLAISDYNSINLALNILSDVDDNNIVVETRNEIMEMQYEKAIYYYENEQYRVAIDWFKVLIPFEYKDSVEKYNECNDIINGKI